MVVTKDSEQCIRLTGWESEFSYLGDSINSYCELTVAMMSTDRNQLVYLMQNFIPSFVDKLTSSEKQDLSSRVKGYLGDKRMCDVGYALSQADDEDITTVDQAARCALSKLEY